MPTHFIAAEVDGTIKILSMKDWAKHFGIDARYFSALFHEQKKQGVTDNVTIQRIARPAATKIVSKAKPDHAMVKASERYPTPDELAWRSNKALFNKFNLKI